jgi:23S rRNA pseudouridine2605 synthase
MDSEGLLLLTSDGEFANAMMHPKHEVNKTYEVWVTGYHEAAAALLARPVTLDGYTIAKPSVRFIRNAENGLALLEVTVHEGRNRQVRRMCDLAGMKVTRLIRTAEGDVFYVWFSESRFYYTENGRCIFFDPEDREAYRALYEKLNALLQ